MFLFDMPLDQLKTCLFPQKRESDFHEFWKGMLTRSQEQPLYPAAEPVAYAVPDVRVEKVSFAAFDGGRVWISRFGRGWSAAGEDPAAGAEGGAIFPNMKSRLGVTFGRRSGLLIVTTAETIE